MTGWYSRGYTVTISEMSSANISSWLCMKVISEIKNPVNNRIKVQIKIVSLEKILEG